MISLPFSPMFVAIVALGAVSAGLEMRVMSLQGKLSEFQASSARALAQAQADARSKEQQAVGALYDLQVHLEQQEKRSGELETQLVDAQRAGTVRVRQSICAPARVPRHATATAAADEQAGDGAEHLARAVRAGRDADEQIRGLQAYAQACFALTQAK